MNIRLASVGDAADIARIYNQGIEERIATFETEPRSTADVVTALVERGDQHPTVVVEIGGAVRAVAWCSAYRPRDCYTGIAEFSVYTDRDFRGRGLGVAIMETLFVEAERRGLWKLVSRVFPENVASRRLLAAVGFREVGTYFRHGRLDGQWRDCVIVEKLIGAGAFQA